MEALGFVLVVVAVAAIFGVMRLVDFLSNSHPLNHSEMLDLAEKRRRNRSLERFDYSDMEQPAHTSEKKRMKASGEFVRCNLAFCDAPARIAGMLKSKKH